MEVIEQSYIKRAYRFTDKLKDRIYSTVSSCYGAMPEAIFDEDGDPAMKFRLYSSRTDYEEKTVYIGDYIVFNCSETQVLEVLTSEEYNKKYTNISE